jgi:hypothetical protein
MREITLESCCLRGKSITPHICENNLQFSFALSRCKLNLSRVYSAAFKGQGCQVDQG